MKRTPYSKFKNKQEKNLDPLFYLSNYRYGGGTTFTAHLLHILKRKYIICISEAFERNIGHFGYGVLYKREQMKFLYDLEKMFITNMYQNFHLLDCLRAKDITIVIHAPGEISKENESYLKHWRIIVIRKALQMFLRERYHIKAKFLYHPFYLYKKFKKNTGEQNESNRKDHAVAISRIDYFKNTDIVLKANKGINKPIKIFGWANPHYVHSELDNLQFDKYYHGVFPKSFIHVSRILSKSKFMIDLSELQNDGGGTQYTFLDAIYSNCAIILNRKWIESVDRRHSDFKEGYNCYAISNEQELMDLINNSNKVDTTKVVENAKKLLSRHVNVSDEWNKLALS